MYQIWEIHHPRVFKENIFFNMKRTDLETPAFKTKSTVLALVPMAVNDSSAGERDLQLPGLDMTVCDRWIVREALCFFRKRKGYLPRVSLLSRPPCSCSPDRTGEESRS